MRLKFGDHRNDWKCCFFCHVRTGTIFLGIWHLVSCSLLVSYNILSVRELIIIIVTMKALTGQFSLLSKSVFSSPLGH
jgi:hypothetical protein